MNLTNIPSSLDPAVESLDLEFNHIQFLGPDSFPGLSSLMKLAIPFNGLEFIDDTAFESLNSLVELYLDNNRLSSLPATFGPNTAGIMLLSIPNNNITTISQGYFSQMKSLEYLDMEFCGLVQLPEDFFGGLVKLKYLYMGGQTVANFSYQLPSLESLMTAEFIGYRYPDENFLGLESLKVFRIFGFFHHYGIPRFQDSFSMETIDVMQNIETVGDISHMKNLSTLSFETVQLECDYRLCWTLFEEYTFNFPFLLIVVPCQRPEYASGKKLLQMTKLELRCFESKWWFIFQNKKNSDMVAWSDCVLKI